MNVKVYVEGGGDRSELRTRCRKGFSTFFRNAGLTGRMPKVVAGGARQTTYAKFRTAIASATENDFIVLLVDSEGPVADTPWTHLKNRDNWDEPADELEENAHLMVQCMEAWFLADRDALASYFGHRFNQRSLPRRRDIENIPIHDLERGLNMATRRCGRKGVYHKGRHSFAILAELSPDRVVAASPHARLLIDTLLAKAF